jgi:hypothetical protein
LSLVHRKISRSGAGIPGQFLGQPRICPCTLMPGFGPGLKFSTSYLSDAYSLAGRREVMKLFRTPICVILFSLDRRGNVSAVLFSNDMVP